MKRLALSGLAVLSLALGGGAGIATHVQAATIPACPPTIGPGSSGSTVVIAQTYLNDDRYVDGVAKLTVDGSFGSATKNAVQHFQVWAFGGTISSYPGTIGPKTWNALMQAYSPSTGCR